MCRSIILLLLAFLFTCAALPAEAEPAVAAQQLSAQADGAVEPVLEVPELFYLQQPLALAETLPQRPPTRAPALAAAPFIEGLHRPPCRPFLTV